MAQLRALVPGTRLVVVGDGPQRDEAVRQAAELGLRNRVRFVGYVSDEDLPGYFAGADAFCSPALGGEALGIVLLEAMAAGAPIVASDIPGYDETVRRDQDGVLVPPGDAAALADALARVLTNRALAADLASSGRDRAASYAWPSVARQTLAYYAELGAASGEATSDPASRRRG
jgi:phosphatidylinositol alpha-mannosyltransferase